MSEQNIENLWPTKIQGTKLRAPVAVLKEQASLLGQMTQNVVVADVRRLKRDSGDLLYGFALIAPALQNYTYWLFEISHAAVQLYPVEIVSPPLAREAEYARSWKATDEANLKNILKEIFSDPKTMSAIQSLLAQSEGLPLPKEDELPF